MLAVYERTGDIDDRDGYRAVLEQYGRFRTAADFLVACARDADVDQGKQDLLNAVDLLAERCDDPLTASTILAEAIHRHTDDAAFGPVANRLRRIEKCRPILTEAWSEVAAEHRSADLHFRLAQWATDDGDTQGAYEYLTPYLRGHERSPEACRMLYRQAMEPAIRVPSAPEQKLPHSAASPPNWPSKSEFAPSKNATQRKQH